MPCPSTRLFTCNLYRPNIKVATHRPISRDSSPSTLQPPGKEERGREGGRGCGGEETETYPATSIGWPGSSKKASRIGILVVSARLSRKDDEERGRLPLQIADGDVSAQRSPIDKKAWLRSRDGAARRRGERRSADGSDGCSQGACRQRVRRQTAACVEFWRRAREHMIPPLLGE